MTGGTCTCSFPSNDYFIQQLQRYCIPYWKIHLYSDALYYYLCVILYCSFFQKVIQEFYIERVCEVGHVFCSDDMLPHVIVLYPRVNHQQVGRVKHVWTQLAIVHTVIQLGHRDEPGTTQRGYIINLYGYRSPSFSVINICSWVTVMKQVQQIAIINR